MPSVGRRRTVGGRGRRGRGLQRGYAWSAAAAPPPLPRPGVPDAAVVAALAAAAPDLARARRRWGPAEIPGLLQRRPDGTVAATLCLGSPESDEFQSPPYCDAARRCAAGTEREPGAAVVGEFHTHPPSGGPWSPPSGADLFQVTLAAATGVHNLSVIVSPEGDYLCGATAPAAHAFRAQLLDFYADQGLTPAEARAHLAACRQPLEAALRRSGRAPLVLAVLAWPRAWFEELRPPAAFAESARTALHLDVRFVPRHRAPPQP